MKQLRFLSRLIVCGVASIVAGCCLLTRSATHEQNAADSSLWNDPFSDDPDEVEPAPPKEKRSFREDVEATP